MGLVDVIRNLCTNAGTSIGAVEKELGFGKGTMYRWNEMIPSADKVQKVADYFNVSIDFLMGRETTQVQSAAAHFDVDTLTDEGREVYLNMVEMLAAKYSKSKQ